MAYEIPPETVQFIDREAEQARIFRAVAEWSGGSRPLCVALRGLGGTGKTELAFRLARTLRERYPDQVLYVDLDDLRRDGVVEVADALGDLLRSLGVGRDWMGQTFKARCKQYWTQTDGKRLIVVIDNARYGSEVVPLLPASGAGLAIVTSHGPLYDLEDGAAVDVVLDPLDDRYAMELLRRAVDDARLVAEPDAAASLLRLCSGLPAALHVAARWLRKHRRRSLSHLLADLTTELHGKGLPMVERVWDAAYRGLGPGAARLYRLLAVVPGPSFTPAVAAAALGCDRDGADAALEELEAAGLLDDRDVLNTKDDRKRLPELLRAHAARRAREDGGDEERAEARQRIVRWYVRQAQRADAVVAGGRMTFATLFPAVDGVPDVPFRNAADDAGRTGSAAGWLHVERHALYACVRLAYAHGLDAEAWALCEPLWTHHLDHPGSAETIEVFRTGVAAAQRAGHLPALVRMRCQLARALWESGRMEEAAREVEQALSAAPSLGESGKERKLRASVVEFRGMLHSAQGDWAAAAPDFEMSCRMHREIANAYGVMLLTYRLGEALAALGDLERAATVLEQAHAEAAGLERERMTARTGFALGGVLHRLGRSAEARRLYTAALTSARRRGSDHDEARILDALAALAEETGNPAEARRHREAAHAIRTRNSAV
ncbi:MULTISPECIES: tetratricopeptide repeat protein [Streptomycetaceae]|uniref:Putative regulator protein n=1 Tax=Streptantibioticus cattleyicolor (strain ATCC 35852 / DSM 46488 / JCM 4925 / NBRC 14057 / NRRL 8057) TaxID=1003195 RepID=F8K2T3_STREN|nr:MULTISPECIES: tetratricopeptide repeat protein [Streptomycetaceae]AEW95469.1 putative regulator protein [Streptantibioticus cattleyicolor NRRL 8057 = DSM 46488]MYS60034.1 tetratricopeptide repeat protein [Streptomyces sp. SID5468]CCB75810.1 putative regulator protein [Streptantibioticus cattleyicolor NRRL 8057 = DSM 46488]